MFSFIKQNLQKIYSSVTSKLQTIFSRNSFDDETIKELEALLLSADTGIKTTRAIIEHIKEEAHNGALTDGAAMRAALDRYLTKLLATKKAPLHNNVYLLVGINGSGKTTFAAKLAHFYTMHGKKVLLVAADTFRAAAVEQLATWAQRTNTSLVTGSPQQDPASVVFTGCEAFKKGDYDMLIIDTAGRLQTKTNLMRELEKIKRSIVRNLPDTPITTFMTIDAMLGQNSFDQAKIFQECTPIDGIVLTKIDGTGKGGIVFSITQELNIPIAYLSYGEKVEQLKQFDADEYVKTLLNG